MHQKDSMNSARVSIIIPTRNRPAFLKQAIDSAYAQTYQDFELIVVNDGGSDEAAHLAKAYDSRLRYITQAHKGAAAARNAGIMQAHGEFVAFLDDDDMYAPDKLQHCVDYLLAHPQVVWLCSGFSFIDARGNALPRNAIIPAKEDVTLHDMALFTFINTCSVVCRRENLHSVDGFPEGVTVSEDYHCWAKILRTGKGAALAKNLVYYRLHPGNTKLPWWRIVRENTRIIDNIMAHGDASLATREHYIQNLHRIIDENLTYKKQRFHRACFRLWRCLYAAAR